MAIQSKCSNPDGLRTIATRITPITKAAISAKEMLEEGNNNDKKSAVACGPMEIVAAAEVAFIIIIKIPALTKTTIPSHHIRGITKRRRLDLTNHCSERRPFRLYMNGAVSVDERPSLNSKKLI